MLCHAYMRSMKFAYFSAWRALNGEIFILFNVNAT